MKKLTFTELNGIINEHNKKNGIEQQFQDQNPLQCVIVFKQESFKKEYSETSRSYRFRSDNKYFLPNMGGNSIFASCLDGTDQNLKVSDYFGEWKIEYCYVIESEIE